MTKRHPGNSTTLDIMNVWTTLLGVVPCLMKTNGCHLSLSEGSTAHVLVLHKVKTVQIKNPRPYTLCRCEYTHALITRRVYTLCKISPWPYIPFFFVLNRINLFRG